MAEKRTRTAVTASHLNIFKELPGLVQQGLEFNTYPCSQSVHNISGRDGVTTTKNVCFCVLLNQCRITSVFRLRKATFPGLDEWRQR